jgi:diguanylate cyclase (GGDEF)-like protein/PAS domain S-box-containing protein
VTSLLISFVSLLVAGGAVLAVLAIIVWRRRSAEAGSELAILLVAAMAWVLGAAAEHLSPTLDAKILAAKFQYLGIMTLSPAAAVTVLRATGRGTWVQNYLVVTVPLAVIGVIVVGTNELHSWLWTHVDLKTAGVMSLMTVEYGPAFSLINLVSQIQLVGAVLLFVQSAWKNWQADATLACVGFLAPWVANVVYQMRIGPWPDLDLTPLGLVVTGVSFTISFHGVGRVFSTVKLAHRDVLEHIADLILVFDNSSHILSANRAARHGLDLPSLPAAAAKALERHPALLAYICDKTADKRRDIVLEVDGTTHIFDTRSVPVDASNAPTSGRVLVLRDVNARRLAESRDRTHREQLRQIIDLIPYPVYAKDLSGRFLFANEACARPYHLSAAAMVGRSLFELHSDVEEITRILADDRRIIDEQQSLTIEENVANGSGSIRTFRTTKVPFFQGDSESPAVVGLSIDVTQERERERLLETLASTDALTNLTNRRSFQEILTRVLENASHKCERAAVLFVDLDRFKMVNDIYGHLAGDEVLRQVADRVQESVRFNDPIWVKRNASPHETTVSRFGGDEFIVLLPKVETPGSSAIVARRLLEALDTPFEVGSDRLQLGASIGIAVFPEDGSNAETLLRHCDQALTSAKRSGRGQFEFFNQSIGAADERRHELEKGLRIALERGELFMNYQPIRAANSATLVGAEALLRWNSPEFGTVSPEEFIPVAEETGLIVPIGLYVIRSVCEQIARWQHARYRVPRISINLSARQLVDPESADAIATILTETKIGGASLEFELTEGSILSQTPIVERTLSSLRELGATFALDDFGTGYSSLSHLRRFHFQRLKIDRSFVNGIGSSDDDEKLVRAVIALATQLDLETVAEGVESEEQLDFLLREGCDYAQGYLIGRPTLAEDFERLLEQEKPDEPADE